ncbi:MAG: CbiX/SirB N-terminal domain-containing protein [Myxococcota bacterium]
MPPPTAIVLLAHGSPDPDWQRPIVALAEGLRAQRPETTVIEAYLGMIPPSLAEAVDRLWTEGHRHVLVLAAFLSPGGRHIKKDVPQLVAEQTARYPELTLTLRPGALGSEPEVIDALTRAARRALEQAETG